MVMTGVSVFFTGSAGTGKSHLLRAIVDALRAKHSAAGRLDAVVVTAPTGIAACNIGGTTVHSFAGFGPAVKTAEEVAAELERNRGSAAKRWRSVQVLVIDEISMLDANTFDKLELVARRVRHNDKPFGGIQLVLAGDFLQLPPVNLDCAENAATGQSHAGRGFSRGRGRGGYRDRAGAAGPAAPGGIVRFCFEATCWKRVVYAQVMLTEVFRQKDPEFIQLLNELRVGKVSVEAARRLAASGRTVAQLEKDRGIKPTRIFALNRDVDKINSVELAKCPGTVQEFVARDEGSDPFLPILIRNCPAADRLDLKRGAQVILLKNIDADRGLVNGARGMVVDFVKNPDGSWPDTLPVVEFERGTWTSEIGSQIVAQRTQIPLKLAYALSIHKSQGMGIQLLEVNFHGIFEYGQAYVALSRAVSLDRVRVLGFQPSSVRAHPRVLAFYEHLRAVGKPLAVSGSTPQQRSAPTAPPPSRPTTTAISRANEFDCGLDDALLLQL